MKHLRTILTLLLALAMAPISTVWGTENLEGVWKGIDGENPVVLALRGDGLFLHFFGPAGSPEMATGQWTTEEGVLNLRNPDGSGSDMEYSLDGDTLKLKGAGADEVDLLLLTREPWEAPAGLAGTWEGTQEPLAFDLGPDLSYATYDSTGAQTGSGIYIEQDGMLYFFIDNGDGSFSLNPFEYALYGDSLVLEDADTGKTLSMHRTTSQWPALSEELLDGLGVWQSRAAENFAYGWGSLPSPAGVYAYNTEEYAYIKEHGFQSTLLNPLSTFAADVDTASWTNVRRRLLEGTLPPEDAVRIEEMINYFRYDYPAPAAGEPFSVTTEIAPCPWNPEAKLLLVGLQAKDLAPEERPASNLVFLIDVSGSMEGADRLGLAQRAFMMLTEQLQEGDRVSIVTYAGTDSVVLVGAGVEDKPAIMSAIENLFASGSTAGGKGIQTAYRIAEEQFIKGGNNRVILATDGDLNVGVTSEGELTRLIEEKKKSGVFLSVLGFGYGNLKDNKLEALADHGNGHYAYIDTILEARRALVEEMGGTLFTVAKDVKFQIEFNPERVAKYRQIGYENRQLASEDFADDSKDGGEVGAGHRVTALYEIIETTAEEAADAGLKYQRTETTGSVEYLTVSVRAKDPEGDESRLFSYPVGEESVREEMSDNLKFASAVAQTGMLLRKSEFVGTASYAAVAEQLEGISGIKEDPWKDEFAFLVRRLAREEAAARP